MGKKTGPKPGRPLLLPPGSRVGKVIRRLRLRYRNPYNEKRCGLSQGQLSKKAGVGEHVVHLYEAGKAEPWKNLEKVLGALGYRLEIMPK